MAGKVESFLKSELEKKNALLFVLIDSEVSNLEASSKLAQDVEKIEAEFGHKIEDKTNLTTYMSEDKDAYGLTYAKFVPMLVKSIQELSTQVDKLKSELLALKGE